MPEEIGFLTKPALAAGMITRAVQAGVGARWVTGDEVYGADPGLRAECEYHRIGYVLAIGRDRRVPTEAGPVRADELTARLPRHAWHRLSAGAGAKGQRFDDWAWIALLAVIAATEPTHHPATGAADGSIALTCSEIRRLLNHLILDPHRARTGHYQRQSDDLERR